MRVLQYLILSVLAFCCGGAVAFEVDTFKSGMTREQVKEAVKAYSFDRVQDFSPTTLIAYDQPEKGSNRQFLFDFCNDRLVSFQQEMGPAFRNLVTVTSTYMSRHGQPIKVTANNSVTSIGERSELALHWRRGTDVVGVRYTITGHVEQLTLQYEAPNNCWQVPRQ